MMTENIYGNYGPMDNRYCRNKLKLIASWIPQGLSILDAGGYRGLLELYVHKDFYFVVDKDFKSIIEAKNRGFYAEYGDFDKADFSFVGIWGIKFEVIVAADILDLLLNPSDFIEKIKKAAKPGSLFIFSVTNDNTIYHRLKVLFGFGINKTPFNIHYHLRYPTIRQWRDFISKDFQILKIKQWICFGKEKPKWFDWLCVVLARISPSLFARGEIYLCRQK